MLAVLKNEEDSVREIEKLSKRSGKIEKINWDKREGREGITQGQMLRQITQ
jgi:hypothetical protein